jgi:hypothetical protein
MAVAPRAFLRTGLRAVKGEMDDLSTKLAKTRMPDREDRTR